MMYETDLQHLKLKKGSSVSVSLKLLHNSRYQFATNHYQWETCGQGFSDTIVPSSIPVLVVQLRDYHRVFHLPLDFCF